MSKVMRLEGHFLTQNFIQGEFLAFWGLRQNICFSFFLSHACDMLSCTINLKWWEVAVFTSWWHVDNKITTFLCLSLPRMLLTFHESWKVDESLAGHWQLKPSGYSFCLVKKVKARSRSNRNQLKVNFGVLLLTCWIVFSVPVLMKTTIPKKLKLQLIGFKTVNSCGMNDVFCYTCLLIFKLF